MRRGVYIILHVPSGSAYVGGSENAVRRFTWHRHMLRNGRHTSPVLQKLWDKTKEKEWIFAMIQFCRSKELKKCELLWLEKWPGKLLNEHGATWKHSVTTKEKMRLGRAIFLDNHPEAREALSLKAKRQHEEGNFGRATWR